MHVDQCIRRTASLDTLYVGQSQPSSLAAHGYTTILQFDKGTQTEDVYFERSKFGIVDSLRTPRGGEGGSRSCPINSGRNINIGVDTLNDIKIEKVIRQRLQKAQNRGGEHSVSSQTLSPMHGNYLFIKFYFLFPFFFGLLLLKLQWFFF